ANPPQRGLKRALIEPVDQSQGKKVLAAVGLARAELHVRDSVPVEFINRNAEQAIALERAVLERIGGVAGLAQVAGAKGVRIDDQDTARLQVREVGLQGGGVHGHQGIQLVAGRVNVVAAEVDLKTRYAREGTGRRPDFRGKIRERGDVVPQDGRGVGEL